MWIKPFSHWKSSEPWKFMCLWHSWKEEKLLTESENHTGRKRPSQEINLLPKVSPHSQFSVSIVCLTALMSPRTQILELLWAAVPLFEHPHVRKTNQTNENQTPNQPKHGLLLSSTSQLVPFTSLPSCTAALGYSSPKAGFHFGWTLGCPCQPISISYSGLFE